MMAPADLLGVQKNVVGLSETITDIVNIEGFLRQMHDPDGGGATPTPELLAKYEEALTPTTGTTTKKQIEFFKAVRLYTMVAGNTVIPEGDGIDWHTQGYNFKDQKLQKFKMDSLVLGVNKEALKRISSAIILSNSNFLDPSRHQIENAELFMNFIPTTVMSRCVPYLNCLFQFDGKSFKGEGFSRPGLMRFLMGDSPETTDQNRAMLEGNTGVGGTGGGDDGSSKYVSKMGMEAFTAPQSLGTPVTANLNRYNAVQDPFRPLASIESFTINVQSTMRYATNKVGTLVLKLHDRSRMSEIAELIRPAAYTRSKIMIEWGWKHPDEDNNPYARFINGSMRIKENYDVINTAYSFDNSGQVTITLTLGYRGQRALEEIVLGNLGHVFEEFKREVARIRELRKELGLDGDTGISEDVQGKVLLDAGSQGSLPDISPGEVSKYLNSLRTYFAEGKYNSKAAGDLVDVLTKMYAHGDVAKGQEPAAFKQRLEAGFKTSTSDLFNLWTTGPDPFLMIDGAGSKVAGTPVGPAKLRRDQMQDPEDPPIAFTAAIDAAVVTTRKHWDNTDKNTAAQTIVSFGKIFSSTMLQSAMKAEMGEDIQFYYYRINRHAGPASGVNIAEFPIDIERLKGDLSDLVARERTDRITTEQFLNLLINSQLRDIWSPAYGVEAKREQYTPENIKKRQKSKKNAQKKGTKTFNSVGALARDIGLTKPPVIEMFMENIPATKQNKTNEELTPAQANRPNREKKNIVRFHLYDKNADQYPAATVLVKAHNDSDSERFYISVDALSKAAKETNAQINALTALAEEFQSVPGGGLNFVMAGRGTSETIGFAASNQKKIKQLISQTVPTIIIGGNASNVTGASLASKTNTLISTGLLRGGFAGRGEVMGTDGSGVGGLPLRILPGNMTLTTLGCPLFRNNQKWFIDFNTGTNLDTIYVLTQLTHTLAPGSFVSSATFAYSEAYAKYESPPTFQRALEGLIPHKEDDAKKK
jgi:hypothetical protein